MAAGRGGSPAVVRRAVIGVLALLGLAFAVEGGEFGTRDLIRQRHEKVRLGRAIDSLQRVVDSLQRYRDAVEHDPATQERIAREVFGMIRGDKEILYKFTDTTARPPRS